jgi:hypothetical protein
VCDCACVYSDRYVTVFDFVLMLFEWIEPDHRMRVANLFVAQIPSPDLQHCTSPPL